MSRVTAAALVIVRSADGRVLFVRQQRGPYAGSLLLPGGKVEFGESAEEAAHREAIEEAGVVIGTMTPTGVYEMRGSGAGGDYHFVMFAFLATNSVVRTGPGGHHVDGVVEVAPEQVRPHPTVMRILNDAGVGRYEETVIEAELGASGIAMGCFPIATSCGVRDDRCCVAVGAAGS